MKCPFDGVFSADIRTVLVVRTKIVLVYQRTPYDKIAMLISPDNHKTAVLGEEKLENFKLKFGAQIPAKHISTALRALFTLPFNFVGDFLRHEF